MDFPTTHIFASFAELRATLELSWNNLLQLQAFLTLTLGGGSERSKIKYQIRVVS